MDDFLRSFNDWMQSDQLVWCAIVLPLLMPVEWLIHELGHALVGLTRTEGLVKVRVGRQPGWLHHRLGRLSVSLSPIPGLNEPAGSAMVYARYDERTRVALLLGGPVAQAGAGALLLVGGGAANVTVLQIVGAFWVLGASANLMPFSRNGHQSDGARILAVLRRSSKPTVPDAPALDMVQADVYTRWLVLFSDRRSLGSLRRRRVLEGAPSTAGFRVADGRPAFIALCHLALAGWCWREAERGDRARLRDNALDALHSATTTGAPEPTLSRLAVETLLNNVELGLASPGRNDESRIRLLADALGCLPASLRSVGVPQEQQEIAFRYGVATSDIERARFVD